MSRSPKPLTIKQLRSYPAEALKADLLPPTTEGRVKVAEGRDGPFDIYYRLYGRGPIRIVWISGHGAGIEYWADMVRVFGFDNPDKYTSLVFENRGIGQSQAPWSLCSMRDLAQDTVDLLNHLQWTEDKSVHVIGHSMGGMIALELSTHQTPLLASLTLMSTTTHWLRDLSLLTATKQTLSYLIPKSADTRLSDVKSQLFSPSWLHAADRTGKFPTNGDAWAARTLSQKINYKGAVAQAPATVRFKVVDEDTTLRRVAEAVGKGKVCIVHGWDDRIVPVATAEKMWEAFGGRETGVKIVVLDRAGHMPFLERFKDVVSLIEGVVGGGGGGGDPASLSPSTSRPVTSTVS